MRVRLLICLVMLALGAGHLAAHPHIWIDSTLGFEFDRSGISTVRVTWLFDDFYSADMILSFDANRDGELSTAEQRTVRADTFEHLVEVGYFLLVFSGARRVDVGEAQSFSASVTDGRLAYEFTVPVRVPWAELSDLVVTTFDSSYFVDFLSEPSQTRYSHGERTILLSPETLQLASAGYGTIRVPAVKADLQ